MPEMGSWRQLGRDTEKIFISKDREIEVFISPVLGVLFVPLYCFAEIK